MTIWRLATSEYTMDVYRKCMSRTNIDIDDDLIGECMRRYDLPTKRSAVDLALRRLLASSDGVAAILATKGVGWEGDLDEMRAGMGAVEL